MKEEFQKYIDFHKSKGGTGKLYKFELIEYKTGFLKLKAFFNSNTLNPVGTVQGGQINSMLDDVTSLLLIYESKGTIYPNSTNLHSIHHRPLYEGEVVATAEIIKKGKTKFQPIYVNDLSLLIFNNNKGFMFIIGVAWPKYLPTTQNAKI